MNRYLIVKDRKADRLFVLGGYCCEYQNSTWSRWTIWWGAWYKTEVNSQSKGFNPQNVRGHSGYAVVEFQKDSAGFRNAMMFGKCFEIVHHGKKDFYARKNLGDKLYGWISRDDDYNSRNIVGDHLRKNGDLKTVSGKEEEDQRKASTLVKTSIQTCEGKKTFKSWRAGIVKLAHILTR